MENNKIDVLIVDDDKTLCKMLEDMLCKEEHLNVSSTNDGLDARKRSRKKSLI